MRLWKHRETDCSRTSQKNLEKFKLRRTANFLLVFLSVPCFGGLGHWASSFSVLITRDIHKLLEKCKGDELSARRRCIRCQWQRSIVCHSSSVRIKWLPLVRRLKLKIILHVINGKMTSLTNMGNLHCYDVIKNITTSRHSKSIIMHTHGFTDQPWVRMTGYQVLFLCVYELRWRQSINYTKKKDNIKPRWLNKLGQKRIFYMEKHTISFLWHSPSKRHLGCSDNQSQCRIWFILPAHRTFILC